MLLVCGEAVSFISGQWRKILLCREKKKMERCEKKILSVFVFNFFLSNFFFSSPKPPPQATNTPLVLLPNLLRVQEWMQIISRLKITETMWPTTGNIKVNVRSGEDCDRSNYSFSLNSEVTMMSHDK